MEKDIYMGLDKQVVRNIVSITSLYDKGFMKIEVPFKVIRKDDEVIVEVTLEANNKYRPQITKDQETFLRENPDGIVKAWAVQAGEECSIDIVVGKKGEEEQLTERLSDLLVEHFIKYKGLSTKEKLEAYINAETEDLFEHIPKHLYQDKLGSANLMNGFADFGRSQAKFSGKATKKKKKKKKKAKKTYGKNKR